MAEAVPRRTDPVRILVLGDDDTGKTSLIHAFVNNEFPADAPDRLGTIDFPPPEEFPDKVPLRLVDSSPEDRQTMEEECAIADVVLVLYSANQPETLQRVESHWMPTVEKHSRATCPVLLVGSKIDLRGEDAPNNLQEAVMPLMRQFNRIETCVECSARMGQNVNQVFYFAQKAVLHPMMPLYDTRRNVLKDPCRAALRRIFTLCDHDGDNTLNDQELNAFQYHCFNTPLSPVELDGVKNVVREQRPEGINAHGLLLEGFLFLHYLFITRGRLETTWTVLRKFGYGDDLRLHPNIFPIRGDEQYELTEAGRQLLKQHFARNDEDGDRALNSQELVNTFNTSPCTPWEMTMGEKGGARGVLACNAEGSVTEEGFFAGMAALGATDPSTLASYLAYFGCTDPTRAMHPVKRNLKKCIRSKKKNNRDTYVCYVFGSKKSGKTALLNSFIGKPFNANYEPTEGTHLVANIVKDRDMDESKTLVMQEFDHDLGLNVAQSADDIRKCDLVCLVFDSSDETSFKYIVKLYDQLALKSHVPFVIVSTKNDLAPFVTESMTPAEFCNNLQVPHAENVSVTTGQLGNIFVKLLGAATNPFVACPPDAEGERRHATRKAVKKFGVRLAVVSVVAVGAAYVWKHYKK